MQFSLQSRLTREQIMEVLYKLAHGSPETFHSLQPRLAEAFPSLIYVSEGIPMLLQERGYEEEPMPFIKALAAACSQGLAFVFLPGSLGQASSSSNISSSRLLTQQAALCLTMCCSLCSSYMSLSMCPAEYTEHDVRRAQVERAVVVQSSGASSAAVRQSIVLWLCSALKHHL